MAIIQEINIFCIYGAQKQHFLVQTLQSNARTLLVSNNMSNIITYSNNGNLGKFVEHRNKYHEAINNDNKLESNSESRIF